MDPELETLLKENKITAQQAETLERLKPGAYCIHKSWGFGRVSSWDLAANRIQIDFEARKAHPMQPEYAAESLKPLSDDHVRVRAVTDPAGLLELASTNPAGFLRAALQSFGGSATQDAIHEAVQTIFSTPAAAKKFWDAAKRALKKDGHFQVPARRTEPWVLRQSAMSRAEELLETWRASRRIKDQLAAADLILKEISAFESDPKSLGAVVASLDDYARKHRKLNLSETAEAMLLRDDLLEALPDIPPPPGEIPTIAGLLAEQKSHLPSLVAALPAVRQKRLLREFDEAFDEEAANRLLDLIPHAPGRVAAEAARILERMGRGEAVRTLLNRLIADHSISSELVMWLCKDRNGPFADLIDQRILSCTISAMERDQLNEIKATRLQDMLLGDQQLVSDLLGKAPMGDVRDLTRKILMSHALDDLSRRSLLARIIKQFPDMHGLVTGADSPEASADAGGDAAGSSAPADALVVSWTSLERRKLEYEELVNKKIPENSKDIGIAREYGDLRENFEFKSAKEMQAVLMRRKAELEADLQRAQGTDFANTDPSAASIGTEVELETEDGAKLRYAILGAWDSDPERGIVSYQTAIAQAMIGAREGETVTLPSTEGSLSAVIKSIVRWSGTF